MFASCARTTRASGRLPAIAGYDLVLAGISMAAAGGLGISRPAVSGGDLLPVLLLESSAWADQAGGQPRGQRSRADSLEVSSRSGAVSCLRRTERSVTARATDECEPASWRLPACSAVCRSSCARRPRRRCESCALSRSTHFMSFVMRGHAATENQRAGSVPGFSSVHKHSVGWQGFVRGRIPCDAAATGEGGPGAVDRGISQSLRELETSARPSVGIIEVSTVGCTRGCRAAVAGNRGRDRAARQGSRRRNPGDRVRQRCGHSLSDRDAVPDHRRRRGLHRGSIRGLAKLLDSVCVAAAGHGIDRRGGTALCREP